MIPRCTLGRGITGAVRYVLGEGRRIRENAGGQSRVAWIGGTGLPFEIESREDADLARRLMEFDAQHQTSRTRQCEKDCLHLSLSWRPDHRPTHAHMADAAREALDAIGMGNARALFVVHSDEPHAHIHIVASRIDPNTGRAFDLKGNYLKLSRWAEAYERRHNGRVLCRKRAEANRYRRGAGVRTRARFRGRAVPVPVEPPTAIPSPPRPKRRKRKNGKTLRRKFKSAIAGLCRAFDDPSDPREGRSRRKNRSRGKSGKGKSGKGKSGGGKRGGRARGALGLALDMRTQGNGSRRRRVRGAYADLKRQHRRSWLLALWRKLKAWLTGLFRPAPSRRRTRRPRDGPHWHRPDCIQLCSISTNRGGSAIGEQNAVFCSRLLSRVNRVCSLFLAKLARKPRMTQSLFDRTGNRKYLVARERISFVTAAFAEGGAVGAFCLTLAFTGARISEVLALTPDRIDTGNEAIVFETLKQRRRAVFRAVPVPVQLLRLIATAESGLQQNATGSRLWPWGRTTAWKHIKRVMKVAGIADALCKPKALRHGFAVDAGQNGVPLNIVQRWLGHARIETTAIYAGAIGEEERNLAKRAWKSIEIAITIGSGARLEVGSV
jgi:integrase